MFSLDGKAALVTGAATGLGQAIAVSLAEAGACVAITDKPGESLDDTDRRIRPSGRLVFKTTIDVRQPDQIKAGVEAVVTHFGKIDILVNNAGINRPAAGPGCDGR